MSNKNRAIFLDRDGVINEDTGYVHKIKDFRFIKDTIAALQKFSSAGYLIVILTNQSGLARGFFTEKDYKNLTNYMIKKLNENGVKIDGVYYCPHLKNARVQKFRLDCDCRKPKPGLIEKAIIDLNIDRSKSIVAGDKITDIEAGRNANIKNCYLIQNNREMIEKSETKPDGVYKSIYELSNNII